jgi:hypothetical protein
MHGSGGGQPIFENNVNSRHPVMRVVRPTRKADTQSQRPGTVQRMSDDSDLSIERVVQLANKDVCDAISNKMGRSLTTDESGAISAVIGTEHFWARAEELLMFVRHNESSKVQNTTETLAARFRDGTLPTPENSRETTPRVIQCDMCGSTGVCYCIRKGPGTAEKCPRCGGSEKCRHCNGTGTR